MTKDVPGIVRYVLGFNRILDKYGHSIDNVRYDLKPMDLDFLRQVFNVDPNDPDPIIQDIIDPLPVNEEQAKALAPYLLEGEFDFDKYFWELCAGKEYIDPNYTIKDFEQALWRKDISEASCILKYIAHRFDNLTDILYCYNKTLPIQEEEMRNGRSMALSHIINRDLPIKDDEFYNYIKPLLTDSESYISDRAKDTVRDLITKNFKLFNKIKKEYNLQCSDETRKEYLDELAEAYHLRKVE